VKEYPCPYSAQMIVAKIRGIKNQTRRVMKPQPSRVKIDGRDDIYCGSKFIGTCHTASTDSYVMTTIFKEKAPRGHLGDRQYWQEAFDYGGIECDGDRRVMAIRYKADGKEDYPILSSKDFALASKWKFVKGWRGMPAMHMLRSMSRGLDEIVDVRVERVQDISIDDCYAEGLYLDGRPYIKAAYANFWDSINAKGGHDWESNPWVWVYETKPCAETNLT